MIELGQGLGLAGKAVGEGRVVADAGGKILTATKRSSWVWRAL